MKKLLAPLAVVVALGLVPAGASAACPPGTTDPAYCTADVPAAAVDNAKATVSAIKKASIDSLVKAGSLTTKVDAAGPGKITVQLTAKIKRKTVVLGTFTATYTSAAENTKVKIKLTSAGKKALKKQDKSLKVTVTSSFKAKGAKTTTTKKSSAVLKG